MKMFVTLALASYDPNSQVSSKHPGTSHKYLIVDLNNKLDWTDQAVEILLDGSAHRTRTRT